MHASRRDGDEDVYGQAPRGGALRLDGGGVMEQAQKEDLRNITRIVLPRSFNTSPDDYHKARLSDNLVGHHQAEALRGLQFTDGDGDGG